MPDCNRIIALQMLLDESVHSTQSHLLAHVKEVVLSLADLELVRDPFRFESRHDVLRLLYGHFIVDAMGWTVTQCPLRQLESTYVPWTM